jgi:BMFP domain-containing protein YqiC
MEKGPAMTQTNSRFFEEVGRVMTDAMGVAQGVRREVETVMRGQGEKIVQDLNLVRREEFEAVKTLAANAREENERLAERLAALEARIADLEAGGKSNPIFPNTPTVA